MTLPTTSPATPSADTSPVGTSPVGASPAGTSPDTAAPASALPALPSLAEQAERLVALGVAELAGLTPDDLHALVRTAPTSPGALLVVPPELAPVATLAPLLRRGERAGFVVEDMTDVAEFVPLDGLDVPAPPAARAYVLTGLDRGDDLASWSPDEALPELTARGRTPLTLAEGVHWVLQAPDVLERNHCFMTIGSRRVRPRGGLDARTPALWISNGTGRDGRARRDAPKVGWCWARNRHTWLGFASAVTRTPLVG